MIMLLFIFTIFLKQLLWAGFIPLWHFPDEQAHFAQVQNQVEDNPHLAGINTTSREITESEGYLGTLRDWAGNNFFTYHPEFNISYSATSTGIYENSIRKFPLSWRKDMVIKEATAYPPLYYQLSGIAYRLFYNSSIFERVFMVRLLNIIFFAITLYAAHATGRLLFPTSKLATMTLVLLVGFHPMFSFLSAGINSYNIFNASFSVALYLSLAVIHRGLNMRYLVLMLAMLSLSIAGKVQGKLLPFIYFFPFIVSFIRFKQSRIAIGGIVGITGFIALGTVVINFITGRQILPEINIQKEQLVLPNFSFIHYLKGTLRQTIAQTIPWYWGVFRWLSLTLPRPINRIINRLMVLCAIGVVVKVLILLRKKDFSPTVLSILFLIYSSAVYFFGIIFYDYLFIKTHGFSLGIQGRYFFPTIIAHMALLLVGMQSLIPWKHLKEWMTKAVGFGIVLLHTFTFFWLIASYYTTMSSLKLFFLQTSQYKPILFKTPFLEFYLFITIIPLCLFLWYYLRIKEHISSEKN